MVNLKSPKCLIQFLRTAACPFHPHIPDKPTHPGVAPFAEPFYRIFAVIAIGVCRIVAHIPVVPSANEIADSTIIVCEYRYADLLFYLSAEFLE